MYKVGASRESVKGALDYISEHGDITVIVRNVAEAKLALKELKLKKKELTQVKKQFAEEERQIRSNSRKKFVIVALRFKGLER